MPRHGSYRLDELPPDHPVKIACGKCGRRGQYRAAGLVLRFGPNFAVPDLLKAIAADCPKMIARHVGDQCGAHFVEPPIPETQKRPG